MSSTKNSLEEETLATQLVIQYRQLFSNRGILNQHCTEVAERILPDDKYVFLNLLNFINIGDKRNQEIFDSTGMVALERFGAIVDSLITPREAFWHNLRTNDKTLMRNKAVQDYFQEVTEILFEERYSATANFVSQNQRTYQHVGAYGTGAMFVDDLAGKKGIRYKNIHLAELYLQQNHQGLVDRVCRHFLLTAREAYKQFGDNLPDTVIAQGKTNPDQLFEFLHWCIPNDDQDPFLKDHRGMPWKSYYVSLLGNKLLETGGYQTFPYSIWRYRQATGEAYGRSIAMNILPSLKTLNEQKKTLLKQGHLTVDPIILAHDDGIVDLYDGTPGSVIPGGVSKDGRSLVQAMPTGRVDVGLELMQEEQKLINDSFLVSVFQILTETPEMTATEVMERTREKGILLAPTIGRAQSEYLGPMIEREIDILSRQGRLPEMPLILRQAQGEYKIMYDSPLSRTQKAEWAAGAMRTVQQLQEVAVAMQDPSLLDYINWDIAAPHIADIYGTPSTWINDPATIQAKRQARDQQMRQQQMIDAAPAAAGLLKAQGNMK